MRQLSRHARWTVAVLVVLGLVPVSFPATAQTPGQEPGTLLGTVRDAETGEPVGWLQILLEEANRSTASDQDGRFRLVNVPAGTYTLKTFRIGYEPLVRSVTIPSGDTVRVVLSVASSPVVSGEIVVEGERTDQDRLVEAAVELQGRQLRQNMGVTIAKMMSREPGISMRSMGPAPARPVLRGLGGERLLVLEDGGRTGDLSAASSDHAVVIEPMTAERVEVIRGPAALVYGPNTLGGVVNVVRGYIPTRRFDRMHAEFSTQAESVNRGLSTGGALRAPLGPLSFRLDGTARHAQDVQTPAGELQNTALETYSGSVGASLVRRHGYVGVAGSYYASAYGIPGGFVGAHPDGVTIELDRQHLETRAEYFPHARILPRIEFRGTYSRYHHQEFEADDLLGIEFGVLSYHGTAIAHTGPVGPFRKGAVGLWAGYRDYVSGGFSFTPATVERSLAGFAYQEALLSPFKLQLGVRFDHRAVSPEEQRLSELVGAIRKRTFQGVSASVAGIWQVNGATLGMTVMRSLRLPGIEELFSEGPHLAAYSFEVGNAELDVERGWGVELAGRYERPFGSLSLALYHNYVVDFIYPRNTGRPSRVQLPIYQYSGATARFLGGEASGSWRIREPLEVHGSVSYVRGTLVDADMPLPQIPPLTSKAGVRYRRGALTLSTSLRAAARQDRVGEFEEPTDGYVVWDAFMEYHVTTGRFLHTFDIGIENVTDTEYRDHLSRVRVIMPEPGRNVKVLYKVFF